MNIIIAAAGLPSTEYPLNGIFEFEQAKALLSLGHRVTYLSFDFRPYSYKRRFGFYRGCKDGITTYTISVPTGIYRRFMPALQLTARYVFAKIEKEQGPQDILNAHFYSIGAICATIPLHYNVKLVVTEHSSKLNKDAAAISALDKKVARTAYKNASAVIAVSEALASRLRSNFNIQACVIGDMVNFSVFSNITKTPHKGFNIISVGRLIKGKGFEELIESVNLVVHKYNHHDVQLTIIGEGTMRAAIEQLIKGYSLSGNVKLSGEQNHSAIAREMSDSDLFVLLSDSETFGVSYAESICADIPVIATRCGGPETFVNSRNGILVSKDKRVAETADAINDIMNGRISFTAESVKSTSSIFKPEFVAKKIESIFQNQIM